MVTKTQIAGLMLAAAVVMSSPMIVYADSPHQDGDWHHGKDHHMMAKVLNLSEDQQKQLKDLKEKQKTAMKSIFEQMKSNREVFNSEIAKAVPDMNKINDIQTQLKTIQSQMADNHLNALLEIKKIMTPEQFAGYMALEKEKMLMMHEHHHQFGHKDGFEKNGDKGHSSDDQD